MAVFKCKMCGGDLEIIEGSNICVCQYCETKQTVPTMDSDKKDTLFSRANRLRFNCEFDKAYSVYEAIVADFPEEAEAYWGLVLCKYGVEYVDDPRTAKKIPTCHRSSFNSVMDDENLEKACEYSGIEARGLYREEAKQIEELRRDIIEISSKEDPYDIFICYKETDKNGDRTIDSVIAQDVYEALTRKGYNVFFSRISLEDKIGREYEPYIFSALHSAKIMLVFGTDYEHFNAVWVKNEWSRFLKLMEEDDEKALIPCFKDIDAYDMPKEFAHLQAQDMGKVGAMQDLLRGIEKIIDDDKDEEIEFKVSDLSAVLFPLLNRAKSYLRKDNFEKANEYFDKVLDFAPENEEALLGKLLVEFKAKTIEDLVENTVIFIFSDKYRDLIECCSDKMKRRLEEAHQRVKENYEIALDALVKEGNAHIAGEICNRILLIDKENKKATLYKLLTSYFVTSIEDLAKGITPFTSSDVYKAVCKHCDEDIIKSLDDASEQIRQNMLLEMEESLKKGRYDSVRRFAYSYLSCYPSNDELLLYKFLADIKERSLEEAEKKLCEIYNSPEYSSIMEKCSDKLKKELHDTSERIKDKIAKLQKRQKIKRLIIATVIIGIFMLIFASMSIINNRPMTIYAYTNYAGGVAITGINKPDKAIKDGQLEIPNKIRGKSVLYVSNIDDETLMSVTLPDTVTVIGENAFSGCVSLKSIIIPNSVIEIGESAFSGCSSLEEIFIPKSVTIVEKHAFQNCKSLTIYCQATEKPSDWAFSWNTNFRPTFWGVEKKGVTEDGFVWNQYADNTVSIEKYNGVQADVVVPSTINGCQVTYIADLAFYENKNIMSVEIPDTVEAIGASVFYGCRSVKTIRLPHNLKRIEDDSFYKCRVLEFIEITWGVEYIGKNAFKGCSSLASIQIPNTVNRIGASAFEQCRMLTRIEIPNGVNEISGFTFYQCEKLESVILPSSLEKIGESAFNECVALANVQIPYGVTAIETAAFKNCRALKSIALPDKLRKIGELAFSCCTSLSGIVIPRSVATVGERVFADCTNLLSIDCQATSKPVGWKTAWSYGTNAETVIKWGFSGNN